MESTIDRAHSCLDFLTSYVQTCSIAKNRKMARNLIEKINFKLWMLVSYSESELSHEEVTEQLNAVCNECAELEEGQT